MTHNFEAADLLVKTLGPRPGDLLLSELFAGAAYFVRG